LAAEIMKKFGFSAAVVDALFTMAGDRRDAKATPSGEVNTN
jgi:hypothetical protein